MVLRRGKRTEKRTRYALNVSTVPVYHHAPHNQREGGSLFTVHCSLFTVHCFHCSLFSLFTYLPGIRDFVAMVPPKIIAEMISAAMDSNKSAPRPAQSPTLSPTKSAMTAASKEKEERRKKKEKGKD